MALHTQQPPAGDFGPYMQRLFDLKQIGDAQIADRLIDVYPAEIGPAPDDAVIMEMVHMSIDRPLFQVLNSQGRKLSALELVMTVQDSTGQVSEVRSSQNLVYRIIRGGQRKRLEKDISQAIRPALERLFREMGVKPTKSQLNNILTMVSSKASKIIADKRFFECQIVDIQVVNAD